MHDLFQVQGLLTVFSDVSTAEAVTHNILLQLISSAASSCMHRCSQVQDTHDYSHNQFPYLLGQVAGLRDLA